MLRVLGQLLHPIAQLRRVNVQVLRRLHIGHASILDQAHGLKLELSRKLPSLHDPPPAPSKHLTRCLRNRVQASKELFQERVHPEKGRKKQDAAIAILDIGRMNDGVQQQTQRVYENMALLALDLFARVIAMRIDAAPPFSALFTLWLSTMAAVGLASRSPCSRHAT